MGSGYTSRLAQGTKGNPQISLQNMLLEKVSKENEANANRADFYINSVGKTLPERYKKWLGVNKRNRLLRKAKNPLLRNAINQLYRPGSIIGEGSTASVIKFERQTGLGLGKNGGTHRKKGLNMVKYLEMKILTQPLSKGDKKLARQLIKKLKKALGA